MWPNIAKMISREDLMVNPKYNDTLKRSENREDLEAIFQSWLDERTREEIFQAAFSSSYNNIEFNLFTIVII